MFRFRLLLEASAGNLPRFFSGILYKFMTSFFFFFFFLLWFVMDDPALRLIFLEVPCTHFSKIKLVQNVLHTFSCSTAFCGKQIWSNRKDSSEHTGGSFEHSKIKIFQSRGFGRLKQTSWNQSKAPEASNFHVKNN